MIDTQVKQGILDSDPYRGASLNIEGLKIRQWLTRNIRRPFLAMTVTSMADS